MASSSILAFRRYCVKFCKCSNTNTCCRWHGRVDPFARASSAITRTMDTRRCSIHRLIATKSNTRCAFRSMCHILYICTRVPSSTTKATVQNAGKHRGVVLVALFSFSVPYIQHLQTSSIITAAVLLCHNHCFGRRGFVYMVPGEDRLVHCVYHKLVFTGARLRACAGLHLDCITCLLLGE